MLHFCVNINPSSYIYTHTHTRVYDTCKTLSWITSKGQEPWELFLYFSFSLTYTHVFRTLRFSYEHLQLNQYGPPSVSANAIIYIYQLHILHLHIQKSFLVNISHSREIVRFADNASSARAIAAKFFCASSMMNLYGMNSNSIAHSSIFDRDKIPQNTGTSLHSTLAELRTKSRMKSRVDRLSMKIPP